MLVVFLPPMANLCGGAIPIRICGGAFPPIIIPGGGPMSARENIDKPGPGHDKYKYAERTHIWRHAHVGWHNAAQIGWWTAHLRRWHTHPRRRHARRRLLHMSMTRSKLFNPAGYPSGIVIVPLRLLGGLIAVVKGFWLVEEGFLRGAG